ncbi:MAG: hypothetical protein IJV07_01805 [Alphaproteobacteria bacterium]|nr:hypothetical protein [Alphaproteobacteria bacterium]
MKKYLYLGLMGLLTACAGENGLLPQKNDLKTCLTNEALARIQDGSALAAPVRTTAKKMVVACLVGEDETTETKQTATTMAQDILSALMKAQ